MLGVGVLLVLPQVVGLAAARIGRRRSAAAWPLAAAGMVGLPLAIAAIFDPMLHTRTDCAGAGSSCFFAISLMVLHFVVGAIFGVLDQRARTRAGK
jgi:uncharacterized membrane protein HdeD (DUF308 family)